MVKVVKYNNDTCLPVKVVGMYMCKSIAEYWATEFNLMSSTSGSNYSFGIIFE